MKLQTALTFKKAKNKRILFFSLLLVIFIAGSIDSFSQSVSLKGSNMPVEKLFDAIKRQTGYTFFYQAHVLNGARPVDINITRQSLKLALDLICKGQSFSYTVKGRIIVITPVAENRSKIDSVKNEPNTTRQMLVKGRIINREGQSLAGATIQLKDKKTVIATDVDGRYSLVADADDQLIVSYVNYIQEIVTIRGRATVDVVMEARVNSLEEVSISTGYQKIEQKFLTGAVTRLKMDSIYQPGLNTVDKMLEGRVPGLIMMQNSGQAGAAPKLRIRGTSTFLGSREPLWVVDGIVQTDPVPVPANKINDLDFVNLVGNAISGLNPNDIESIDVLKDAAATALYGVRAANGVIVITTKRGTPGPPTIKYSTGITYTRRPRYTDKEVYVMNSKERVDVSRELIERQIRLKGVPEAYEKAVMDYYNNLIDYDTYKKRVYQAETMNTDWLGIVTQDVVASNHTLGLSGGNQISRYYASAGYTNDRGVINGEYNKRYTGQVKFDVNYRNFKAEFSIMANKNSRRYTPAALGILNYAYGTSRSIPLYNDDGSFYYFSINDRSTNNLFPRSSFNVINEMNHAGQTLDGSAYMAIANLNYQLLPGLQLETVLSYSSNNTEERTWFDEKTAWVDHLREKDPSLPEENPIPFGGELKQQNNRQTAYTARGQINYVHYMDAGKKHLLNAVFGGELTSTKNNALAQTHRGYYPERGHSFAQIDPTVYTRYATWLSTEGRPTAIEGLTNLASVYASATYIYNDRYVVTANARSDFSNAFGDRSNERFLPTWGISGRWNMDRDIFKNTKWVGEAALRISYGTQGNMLPGQTPYTIIEKGVLNSTYQSFTSTIAYFPNPFLQWEKTHAYNAALDFSFFNTRLNGSVGFFYKKTANAFLTRAVSTINGLESYLVNGGILENKGIELIFRFTPVNNALNGGKKGVVWRIDPQLGQVFNKLLNQAINKNVQTKILDNAVITYNSFLDGSLTDNGKPVNTFYAYRFKGLDNNGAPVFYGAEPENAEALKIKYDGMSSENVFRELMVEAGRREPLIQGGIYNYLGYGPWALDFNLTYGLGYKIRLLQIASGNYGTKMPSAQQNLRREFVDRWRYPGDELTTKIPGLMPQGIAEGFWLPSRFAMDYYQMYDNSDLRVVSGNYLKLQSATLRYTCSPQLCSLVRLKAAVISLSGSNLYTWASRELGGQDPTQSGTTPDINLGLRPVYVFAVNVSF